MRFNSDEGRSHETPNIDKFIEDVILLSKKYGYSISHEDHHGAFVITNRNKSCDEWLREAHCKDLHNKYTNKE